MAIDNFEFEVVQDFTDMIILAKNTALKVALEAVGLQAEGYAKRKCPVDTGNLRNNIVHLYDANTAYIGTDVEYAPYVEFGTSRTAAQPFLRPAAFNHGAEYKKIFEEYLHNAPT